MEALIPAGITSISKTSPLFFDAQGREKASIHHLIHVSELKELPLMETGKPPKGLCKILSASAALSLCL